MAKRGSSEWKENISLTLKGRIITWGKKIGNSNKGRKNSIKSIKKMRAAHLGKLSGMKGKKHTERSKQKMSISKKGKVPFNKGIKLQNTINHKLSAKKRWDNLEERRKQSNRMKGANNHRWKGGKVHENKIIRKSLKYKLWRMSIFKKDNYTCQECGQISEEIRAHHIIPFSKEPIKRFDINNGITMCNNCHLHIHQVMKNV